MVDDSTVDTWPVDTMTLVLLLLTSDDGIWLVVVMTLVHLVVAKLVGVLFGIRLMLLLLMMILVAWPPGRMATCWVVCMCAMWPVDEDDGTSSCRWAGCGDCRLTGVMLWVV